MGSEGVKETKIDIVWGEKITFQDLTIFRFMLVYLFMNTNLSKAKLN